MRNIASLLLAAVLIVGTFSSASVSAAEWYTKDANGRLTYHNDGRPGYVAPRVHRHQHYQSRSWGRSMYLPRYQRNHRSDDAVAGIILFGLGATVGAAIVNSQQQPRPAQQLTPEQQHCVDTNGVWLEDTRTRRQFCGWR